jgi:hypothetical protein
MPGQERDCLAGYLPYRDRIARRAERGIDLQLFGVLEELVKP